jgi:hypothetical protein
MQQNDQRRQWVLVATWFSTIAFVGLLKRILEKQKTE